MTLSCWFCHVHPAQTTRMIRLPSTHVAGTTLSLTQDLPEHPSPTWVLSYALVRAGTRLQIVATAGANGTHDLTLTAAACAAWGAGVYHYQATATSGSVAAIVDSGTIEIKPNFAAASTGYDARSPAEKILDAVNALLQGVADDNAKRTRFRDRELETFSMDELLKLRSRMLEEVKREQAAAAGLSRGQTVRVRF